MSPPTREEAAPDQCGPVESVSSPPQTITAERQADDSALVERERAPDEWIAAAARARDHNNRAYFEDRDDDEHFWRSEYARAGCW